MTEQNSRVETPIRYRKPKDTTKIPGLRSSIEKLYGLPKGSVKLVNPDGRAIRADASLATLRKNWGED